VTDGGIVFNHTPFSTWTLTWQDGYLIMLKQSNNTLYSIWTPKNCKLVKFRAGNLADHRPRLAF